MAIVQLEHVCKAYDTKVAVEDLSFLIEPATMFGLLGPTGSGNTSSTPMITGLAPVTATLLTDTLIDLRKDGRAILFSTHRMDQVEKMCDAICLISRGKQVLAGSMREVKSRYPRNRVQITFEGSNAFLQNPG